MLIIYLIEVILFNLYFYCKATCEAFIFTNYCFFFILYCCTKEGNILLYTYLIILNSRLSTPSCIIKIFAGC